MATENKVNSLPLLTNTVYSRMKRLITQGCLIIGKMSSIKRTAVGRLTGVSDALQTVVGRLAEDSNILRIVVRRLSDVSDTLRIVVGILSENTDYMKTENYYYTY